MKKILIFLLAFTFYNSFSQEIVKESLDNGGGHLSGGNITAFYTVGEAVVAEKSNGFLFVSEGFINSNLTNVVGVEDYSNLTGVKVFPNPTTRELQFNFDKPEKYQIQIFDLLGRELMNKALNSQTNFMLDVSYLSSATYLVVVKNNNTKQYKTYRIIKK